MMSPLVILLAGVVAGPLLLRWGSGLDETQVRAKLRWIRWLFPPLLLAAVWAALGALPTYGDTRLKLLLSSATLGAHGLILMVMLGLRRMKLPHVLAAAVVLAVWVVADDMESKRRAEIVDYIQPMAPEHFRGGGYQFEVSPVRPPDVGPARGEGGVVVP